MEKISVMEEASKLGSVLEIPEWLIRSHFVYVVESRDGQRLALLRPDDWWDLYKGRSFSAKVYLKGATRRMSFGDFTSSLGSMFSGDPGEGPFVIEYHENRVNIRPMTSDEAISYIDGIVRAPDSYAAGKD